MSCDIIEYSIVHKPVAVKFSCDILFDKGFMFFVYFVEFGLNVRFVFEEFIRVCKFVRDFVSLPFLVFIAEFLESVYFGVFAGVR